MDDRRAVTVRLVEYVRREAMKRTFTRRTFTSLSAELGILVNADVRTVTVGDLPGRANLVWGSFPCQDLSLAGAGAGLRGDRSGTFWPFWELVEGLVADGRAPELIALELENVCGALTSHEGRDFASICAAIHRTGYRFGAVVIDGALFVPQSRPRLSVVGVRFGVEVPASKLGSAPNSPWHTTALRRAYGKLPPHLQEDWIWWKLPVPTVPPVSLASIIEDDPADVRWHSQQETDRLLGMMSGLNRAKLETAQRSGARIVGTVYKRTRQDEVGRKVQRAEIRFDGTAGCLRTPMGGSSRQSILVVEGGAVRSRLISGRETARLMGLPDDYELPENYNEAYHLTGDGVHGRPCQNAYCVSLLCLKRQGVKG